MARNKGWYSCLIAKHTNTHMLSLRGHLMKMHLQKQLLLLLLYYPSNLKLYCRSFDSGTADDQYVEPGSPTVCDPLTLGSADRG